MCPSKSTTLLAMSLRWPVYQKAGASPSKREFGLWGGELYKYFSNSLFSLIHPQYVLLARAPNVDLGF